jgi:hypothetical protein
MSRRLPPIFTDNKPSLKLDSGVYNHIKDVGKEAAQKEHDAG